VIFFAGDLYLGTDQLRIDSNLKKDIFHKCDYIICNFENVYDSSAKVMRADKSSLLYFNENNLEIFIKNTNNTNYIFLLGNNHIHDLGRPGLRETQNILSKYSNISFTGADVLPNVKNPFIFEDGGKRIGILSCSTDSPELMSRKATTEFEGVLDFEDESIEEIIQKWKPSIDYLIVSPHWGREYIDYPSVQLRRKARSWIDAGADLVIGHHPHIIQGKENYKEKLIYYSLGNFIFPNFYDKYGVLKKWEKRDNYSIGLLITLKEKLEIEEYGFYFEQNNKRLSISEKSINKLIKNSIPLDNQNYSFQKYYGIWEKNYIDKISKYYDRYYWLKRALFLQHKEKRWAFFLIDRIIKKIKGFFQN
jgi:hypothetical protein